MKDRNGIDRGEMVIDRSHDRYFVTEDGVETETTMEGFVAMERRCGFHPKPGCGPIATGSFSSGSRSGRIEHWFDGPAKVFDTDTGDEEPVEDCETAFDRARELNRAEGRRRHYAQPA